MIDPGIGFGKTAAQNLALVRGLGALRETGYPVLLGASRKSFIGAVTGSPVDRRLAGSLAAAGWAARSGAELVRVHDVAETRQFLDVWRAIEEAAMTVLSFLRQLSWRDVVDVLVVALVVYNLLMLIRGTRAVQILLGIVFVGVAYWAAQLAGLETVGFLLERFLLVLPFAILVLFQHEIRRALANFGSNPFLHRPTFQREEAVAESVSQAAVSLAARRIGALVVIERLEGLRDYVERGTGVDAALSADLLVSLFSHGTPLHDGAVILVHGRRFGGRLPPAAVDQPGSRLGARHPSSRRPRNRRGNRRDRDRGVRGDRRTGARPRRPHRTRSGARGAAREAGPPSGRGTASGGASRWLTRQLI